MRNRSVLVAFLIICTGVFALLTIPTTVIAAPGDQWARWFVEASFDNNQPVVEMTIEIGYEDRSGNLIVGISETFSVACQENGKLHISNNAAKFDGSSYLICDMPNFQEKVLELTNGQLQISDECDCKEANGEVGFNFSKTSENPLFYLPDLQFSAPMNAIATLAQYRLTVRGNTAESEPFPTNYQMQWGGAAFEQSGSGYLTLFHVDGVALGSSPPYIPGILTLPTNPTEFFIGYNPDTGEALQGQLEYLIVDPGCVGHGGI